MPKAASSSLAVSVSHPRYLKADSIARFTTRLISSRRSALPAVSEPGGQHVAGVAAGEVAVVA
jgi:hypothetical protein